ncbi:MAG: GIY-YIG nuclease family protein [Ruminococcus sp.]
MDRNKNQISSKSYFVYILRCSDDSLYTGITPDIKKRMMAHCGKIKGGAKYTKSHPAVKIESAWKTEGRIAAARMECAIKKLTRSQKLSLVSEPDMLCEKYVLQTDEYIFQVCERDFLDSVMNEALKKDD